MSEKRYERGFGATSRNDMFSVFRDAKTGVSFEAPTACDLLNEQAETIEVLREWIKAYHDESNLAAEERGIVIQKKNYPQKRVELAKRRIAALEGK